MSNKDIILVGQFGSPVGLKGEIKVNMMTTSFEVFKNLKNYYNFDGSVAWNFKNILFKNNKCVVQVEKYFSREDVLELKGQKIFSNKKFFPKTKDNEFYINDLIECMIFLKDNTSIVFQVFSKNKRNEFYINDLIECMIFLKDNTSIGKVLSVQNFGDLLEVKYNTKLILIPFDKTNILSVNINKKEIIADPIPGILD